MESQQQYIEAKRARGKVRELAQIELLRQIKIQHEKHESELKELEVQQQQDFLDFQEEWQVYLAESEQKAYELIKKLYEAQEKALVDRREEVLNRYHRFVYSKQYCKLRAQEKTFFAVREYVQADKCRREADALETIEKQKHE